MPDELIVPSLVVTEAAYLLGARGGPAAAAMFSSTPWCLVVSSGSVSWTQHRSPRNRLAGSRLRDLSLGTVDASVIALAERLGSDPIATVGRRDFSIVRPTRVPAHP